MIEVIFLIKISNSLRITYSTKIAKMSKNTWENQVPDRERISEEADDNFLNGWMEEVHDEGDMDEINLIFGENDEDEEHSIALVWSCSCFLILSNSFFAFNIVNSLQYFDLSTLFSVEMI